MKKMHVTALALACAGVSGFTQADWFFRGTSNAWAATAMVAESATQYSTCQVFAAGDGGGGARFKIDRTGNWAESYPATDFNVTSGSTLKILFNSQTKVISVSPVESCGQTGFDKVFSQLNARGTFNGWASTSMTLSADHQWQLDVHLDGQSQQRVKFDVLGDWSTNYGDTNSDGVLEKSGADIYVTGTGDHRLTVNDQTLAYTVQPLGTSNQLPMAVINPASPITLLVGENIALDASSSVDTDGYIASYAWSDGTSADMTNFTAVSPGTFTVELTVTDDQGAEASTSVTIQVQSVSADQWYFRGTPNSWSALSMASSDGTNFCTQQHFASDNPRFKIDHFGDWTESYPAQDYIVAANQTFDICFNASTNVIDVQAVAGADTLAPTVTANPSAGSYAASQAISLSVADNQDLAPAVYYTLDGSQPTPSSSRYNGEAIVASDINGDIDLMLKTLAVDASGNENVQVFNYRIGAQPLSGDFRSETIYFLMTARFYDGDETNNYYNRDRYKAGDPHWRGDFKGLIAKLDYIKDLGFTAIWVTPPVENRSGLDYHGYHAYDFYKVDPRLESPGADYKAFIDAAHAKGLKVIQDVVVNHSGQYGLRNHVWIDHLPIKYFVPAGSSQGLIDNGPYQGNLGDYVSLNRCDDDNAKAPDWYRARCNSDPEGVTPLVDPKTGVTVPLAGYNANRFFGIDAQGLDPAWYHLDGFMAGGDWENPDALQKKHLAGDTIDLATENQNVKDYVNNAIHQYLDMGVDAIRIDTLKHIERDEMLSYVHDWQAYKPGLFVFGENLVKGTGFGSEIANDNASAVIRPWWYTRTTQDPSNPNAGGDSGLSVLDFSLFSTFRDNVTRGHFGGVGGIFAMDWIYGDATKLVTFFQNHDVGPDNDFKYRFGGEQANAALVYNLLWTARGIPTLYYGEEIMFKAGFPQDIASANDTLDQTGRAYFGPHLDDLATTQSHPMYQHIKRLNQIRKAVPALQKAPMSQVNEWGAGISFVRDLSTEGSYALVGLAASGAQSVSMSGIKNGTYRDAITGSTLAVSNGSASFTVPAYGARIWVLNGPGKIGVSGTYLN
ncbi:alpha-amylase family glycosyl hydrolase [Simiduia curdlanivorans]|uniref:Alpha-amylase family glycosyl hydrolase n=1 Tax=Simiduia curdlanivorans TaxID=1492769 RepID=A0ABV8V5U9_9GAMM|nr:alpha-amylase family glycosyl hydrolase [Simiduia curdlanivorans]MDN3638597.1 alpha-amylase family glycosyl hydrolase [Simiduia curdlanivorans]